MLKKFYSANFYIIKAILRLFAFMFLFLSYAIPRRKDIWAFGSYANAFVDNSKYLFLEASENKKSIKSVWISGNKKNVKYIRSKGLNAYYRWSLKGVYYALVASKYFYSSYVSDINLWTSGGALKINLWHGIPLKKIEFDIKTGPLAKRLKKGFISTFLYPAHHVKPNYVLAPTEHVAPLFSSAFSISLENCLVYRYPRNEVLVKDEKLILEHVMRYEAEDLYGLIKKLKSYSKVYIYMPTWRDAGNDFLGNSGIDFEELNDYFYENNYILLLKLHPNTKIVLDFDRYSNIVNFKGSGDIYPVLPFTDCLITDYSSIMFDYALMDKQILYYPFDKDSYLAGRDMYFKYSDFVPASLISYTYEDLFDKIKAGVGIQDYCASDDYLKLTAGLKEKQNFMAFLES